MVKVGARRERVRTSGGVGLGAVAASPRASGGLSVVDDELLTNAEAFDVGNIVGGCDGMGHDSFSKAAVHQ